MSEAENTAVLEAPAAEPKEVPAVVVNAVIQEHVKQLTELADTDRSAALKEFIRLQFVLAKCHWNLVRVMGLPAISLTILERTPEALEVFEKNDESWPELDGNGQPQLLLQMLYPMTDKSEETIKLLRDLAGRIESRARELEDFQAEGSVVKP